MPESKNVYQQLVDIAEKESQKNLNDEVKVFTHYQDDLHIHDKEELLESSQKHDRYIWALKDNGCGTQLVLAGTTNAEWMVDNIGEKSKFYSLSLSGINTGEVKPVSKDEAMGIVAHYSRSSPRVPRISSVFSTLLKEIEIASNQELQYSLLMSDMSPEPGNLVLAEIKKTNYDEVQIKVLRPTEKSKDISSKSDKTYTLRGSKTDFGWKDKLDPKYIKFEVTHTGLAKMKETDKKDFSLASKKIRRQQRKLEDSGLNP